MLSNYADTSALDITSKDNFLLPEDFSGGGGDGGIYAAPAASVYTDPVIYQTPPFVVEPAPGSGPSLSPSVETLATTSVNAVDSSGNILDLKTGKPVAAHWKWFNLATHEVYGAANSDHFHVWANDDIPNVYLEVTAEGYESITIQAAALQPFNDILLKKHSMVYLMLIAAALAALVLFAKKKKKKVGAVTTKDVEPFLLIGGGLLAFSVVKKLLEALGVWQNKDSKELDQVAQSGANFWNPNYWQTVKPAGKSYNNPISEATALQWAEEVYDAFGAFNDCEECAITVFKRCQTQANASFLCWAFQNKYGQDMLTFLRGGWWPQDRLSDSDVNTINNYVNSLPAY